MARTVQFVPKGLITTVGRKFAGVTKAESLHNKVHNQEKAKKNNMDKLEKVKKQKASRKKHALVELDDEDENHVARANAQQREGVDDTVEPLNLSKATIESFEEEDEPDGDAAYGRVMNLVAIAPRLLLNEAGDGVRDIVDIKRCLESQMASNAIFDPLAVAKEALHATTPEARTLGLAFAAFLVADNVREERRARLIPVPKPLGLQADRLFNNVKMKKVKGPCRVTLPPRGQVVDLVGILSNISIPKTMCIETAVSQLTRDVCKKLYTSNRDAALVTAAYSPKLDRLLVLPDNVESFIIEAALRGLRFKSMPEGTTKEANAKALVHDEVARVVKTRMRKFFNDVRTTYNKKNRQVDDVNAVRPLDRLLAEVHAVQAAAAPAAAPVI